jgi:hypothetical protein
MLTVLVNKLSLPGALEAIELTVYPMPPDDPDVVPEKVEPVPPLTERLVVTADADEVISPNMATTARAAKVRLAKVMCETPERGTVANWV